MLTLKVRIGIDVGGTFTDAVVLDSETYELIGQAKVPTTHSAPEGVARGIVEVLKEAVHALKINPKDVEFIAHGTTQATNALLEGDVVKVGILSYGEGLEGRKVNVDTQIKKIDLAPGRYLTSTQCFIEDLSHAPQAVEQLQKEGAEVIVAATSFSVDDSSREEIIMEEAIKQQMPAVGTHEISKLYGLKTRTKTAVINGSILPKMVEAASMTQDSVQKSGIAAPLMVMRCDGGVMGINEVMKRPILTMLSGPAAGVAGALMYEKVSQGLFLEVGGTSTDISAIVNGRVMVGYAEVGGHKTYVNSLDVRTVGVAGGSMIRMKDGQLKDVGPRSAHIAGLPYVVFQEPEKLTNLRLITVRPTPEDSEDYVAVENERGDRFAITLSCAANLLGLVSKDDYSRGNIESAKLGFAPLAEALGCSTQEAAETVMKLASAKNIPFVKQLLMDYKMDASHTVLVGGGGGASVIVPHLAKTLGMRFKIAKNAEVISPIGVALALVRDVVERTIAQPTQEDIISIREEAERLVIKSGANPETVDVHVEIDAQRNLVRAIATGATDLRTKERGVELPQEKLLEIAAESLDLPSEAMKWVAGTDVLEVFTGEEESRKFFGLVRRKAHPLSVIDREGVIRLQLPDALVTTSTTSRIVSGIKPLLEKNSKYGDGGIEMPRPYLVVGGRILDFTSLISPEQVASLTEAELQRWPAEQTVVVILGRRT